MLVPGDAVAFEAYVASLPARVAAPKRPRGARARTDHELPLARARLLDIFPWLSAAMVDKALEEAEKEVLPAVAEGLAEAAEIAHDLDEMHDIVAKAMDHLMEIRMAYADEEDEPPIHFYSRIVGGRWTAEHVGVAADSSIAYARRHSYDWCRMYRWPRQKGFAFATYSERNAVELSKEWVRRGNYYKQLWDDAGSPLDFAYTDAHVEGYEESLVFLEWACSIDADTATMDRIIEVRRVRPVLQE